MTKGRNLLALIVVCCVQVVAGQSSYKDSLLDYQHNYKKDLYSIIRYDTAWVKFYPVDPAYRVTADVEKLRGEQFFQMATSGEKAKQAIRYAVLTFKLRGKDYRLFAYQLSSLSGSANSKDNFFIPFTDSSSGIESYGGGKYIDFITGDITPGNKLVIDFNRSYNPYCAFTTGYNCPIPPAENDLPVTIKAGELNFGKPKH